MAGQKRNHGHSTAERRRRSRQPSHNHLPATGSPHQPLSVPLQGPILNNEAESSSAPYPNNMSAVAPQNNTDTTNALRHDEATEFQQENMGNDNSMARDDTAAAQQGHDNTPPARLYRFDGLSTGVHATSSGSIQDDSTLSQQSMNLGPRLCPVTGTQSTQPWSMESSQDVNNRREEERAGAFRGVWMNFPPTNHGRSATAGPPHAVVPADNQTQAAATPAQSGQPQHNESGSLAPAVDGSDPVSGSGHYYCDDWWYPPLHNGSWNANVGQGNGPWRGGR